MLCPSSVSVPGHLDGCTLRQNRRKEYVLTLSSDRLSPDSLHEKKRIIIIVHKTTVGSVTGLIHLFVAPVRWCICSEVSIPEVSYDDKKFVSTSF